MVNVEMTEGVFVGVTFYSMSSCQPAVKVSRVAQMRTRYDLFICLAVCQTPPPTSYIAKSVCHCFSVCQRVTCSNFTDFFLMYLINQMSLRLHTPNKYMYLVSLMKEWFVFKKEKKKKPLYLTTLLTNGTWEDRPQGRVCACKWCTYSRQLSLMERLGTRWKG